MTNSWDQNASLFDPQQGQEPFKGWLDNGRTDHDIFPLPKGVEIPTLHVDLPANPDDRTIYPDNLNLVSIYQEAREGVVHIRGQLHETKAGQTETKEVTGTGFFVTSDGKLATDYHVVKNLQNLTVETADGRIFPAKIEAVSPKNDLAIVKVEYKGALNSFHVLPLAERSTNLWWGDDVVVLGYPNGWKDMYVSPGTFSSTCLLKDLLPNLKDGLIAGENPDRVLLESITHIENGNSGGPILDSAGRVVGVVGISNLSNRAEATPVEDLLAFLNETQRYTYALPTRIPLGLSWESPRNLTLRAAIELAGKLTQGKGVSYK